MSIQAPAANDPAPEPSDRDFAPRGVPGIPMPRYRRAMGLRKPALPPKTTSPRWRIYWYSAKHEVLTMQYCLESRA